MNDENIQIWKSVENTNKEYTKSVSLGGWKFQTIDAHYQILQATKLWGPYGSTWGVKDEKFTPLLTGGNDVASILYTATFFYPKGSFPINSDIRLNSRTKSGYKENNDYAKKVSTDALTKGLSKLGFSADVFMGKFDGNKYDGIESFDIDFSATEEEIKKLKKIVSDLMPIDPDKAQWIDQEIVKGVDSKRAKTIIKSASDFLEKNNERN